MCQCSPGYTGADGAPCFMCPVNTFKAIVGNAPCEVCPLHSTQAFPLGNVNCLCNADLYMKNGTCTACPLNSHSLIGSTLCTCNAGYFGSNLGNSECRACPVNSATNSAAITLLTDCKCVPGYTSANGGECEQCFADTYKMGLGSASCTACPTHSTSLPGSTLASACVCGDGYAGPENGVCTPCGAGTYREKDLFDLVRIGHTAGVCHTCPANSISLPGSVLLEDCKCKPGYTGPDGGPCTACEPGKYKPDTGSAPCQLCPAGTFNSKHAAHAVTSCTLCKHGKYNPDAGSGPETHCIQCPQGKFHRTKGVTSVDECKECSCNAF